MKNIILGLNAVGINTSASLIIDNKIICAAEEERFSREKRTRKFPIKSIDFCLKKARIKMEDLSAIAISWNPIINLEKFNLNMSQNLSYFPSMLHSTINYIIQDLEFKNNEYFMQKLIINDKKHLEIYYVNHHFSHACNYFFSPFSNASILTLDGFGENECMGFYSGKSNKINKILSQNFPHSLGSFYSTFTEFCGFKPQSEEWKLMGASSYGQKSNYYKLIKNLVSLNNSGGFNLNLKYFNHYMFHRPHYYNDMLIDYLKTEPNGERENLKQKYFNIAYAAQKTFEEIYYHLINHLYKKNKSENLVLSGGSTLNCVANGKVLTKSKFKKIFVPPVSDDSGAGLGAAYYVSNKIFKTKKKYIMTHNYLGPAFDNKQIYNKLKKFLINFTVHKNILDLAVESILNGKIIAWFQGSLEFGDRALGNRSILADPRNPHIKDKINKKIKFREKFRPFAPAILEDKVGDFFVVKENSLFMEKALKIKTNKGKLIPAVTHIDGTGRLQTVSKKSNKKFYSLIHKFYKKTDIPILLNTSFNIQGEPIVCSIEDAITNFYLSGLDELYIGDCLIKKK